MLFDPTGRVLLIRCAVMRADGEFVFWLTPGGEIETGENPREAARRELQEELGLEEVELVVAVYSEATQCEHQGEMRDNLDFVFTACAADAAVLRGMTEEEIEIMKEIRWWAAAGIEAAMANGERIFPVDLAARIRAYA
jgi:ADP-ribose pyrophosphatase YjhB (NUDIX family)